MCSHVSEIITRNLASGDYVAIPLSVTRRKLDGLRDSLVTSSVWKPEFKRTLDTFPDLEVSSLDFAIPGCDACHLGGRMSTRLCRLSGMPYDRDTFEVRNFCDDNYSPSLSMFVVGTGGCFGLRRKQR